ncbi:MAG: 50S ribosomal protein L30 [Selenomonadaceae bacterium]|nr:50S ribosomal protein L30 [Selenomonadaceae bacterium]
MAMLKVTLKRSLISRPETQRKTVRSLGLRKLNSFSILPDVPTIRGQIFKVKHLVAVEEISDEDAAKLAKKSVKLEKKAEPKAKVATAEVKAAEVETKVEVETKAETVDKEKIAAKAQKIVDAVKKSPAIAEKIVDAKKSEDA